MSAARQFMFVTASIATGVLGSISARAADAVFDAQCLFGAAREAGFLGDKNWLSGQFGEVKAELFYWYAVGDDQDGVMSDPDDATSFKLIVQVEDSSGNDAVAAFSAAGQFADGGNADLRRLATTITESVLKHARARCGAVTP